MCIQQWKMSGCVCAVFLFIFAIASNAPAIDFIVDTTKDNYDLADKCDFVTSTSLPGQDGLVSFREVICVANADPGPDTITFDFPASSVMEIILSRSLPPISDDLDIQGLGVDNLFISGDNAFQILDVDRDTTVTISNLTIHKGFNAESAGGAIFNDGKLIFNRVVLKDSLVQTQYIDIGGYGGAIYNSTGDLYLYNCALYGNAATAGPTISTDAIGKGGAIYNYKGSVSIVNCSIFDNVAQGGRWETTFRGSGIGGGVLNNIGFVRMVNTTVTNNSALIGWGERMGSSYGGGLANEGGLFSVQNCMIVENFAETSNQDLYGTFGSQGYNVIGHKQTGFNGPSDIVSDDPRITGPELFGGPTLCYMPGPSSPAVNAGTNDAVSEPTFPAPYVDQRNEPRIINDTVDIGAVESNHVSYMSIH